MKKSFYSFQDGIKSSLKDLDDKIQESLYNSLELNKSNKEKLLYELKLILGMIDLEERKIKQNFLVRFKYISYNKKGELNV